MAKSRIDGLYHPSISTELVSTIETDLRAKVEAFANGNMSWDALLGTFVELVDESYEEGASTARTGRLMHYAMGFIHGLTDRDPFLGMEDA